MVSEPIVIHWFRRDLRLNDNHALYAALKSGYKVLPLFIFDKNILSKLDSSTDARVTFIYQQISVLDKALRSAGGGLYVCNDSPEAAFKKLLTEFNLHAVYTNHDYEPYALQRDQAIGELINRNGSGFMTFKDQVLFEKSEVTKDDGKPYTIYTPFSRKWITALNRDGIPSYPSENASEAFLKWKPQPLLSLSSMGFEKSKLEFPDQEINKSVISKYDQQRDYPGIEGTSKLGIHLRFGTVSIREQIRIAKELNATWLNELCWREFYQMILWHFPYVVNSAFKPAYNAIQWRNNESEFERWKAGNTGYPIVDAGMRELAATGYMHNRVRMIVASFLTKHLLIDWRWGEAWFAEKLLDFELASNNGGWQWAAGSGCDAAPYFRIFNPYEQTKKFDPDLKYIRKWVPEFEDLSYPQPIVNHKDARERCLRVYSEALKRA